MAIVTAIEHGWTNTGRFPYALARLDCGHLERVHLRDTTGKCCKCGAGLRHVHGSSFQRCACGAWMTGEIDSPNPHKPEDRATKVGDAIACETCAAQAQQLAWLEALDASTVHHARFRYGSYHLYRLDHESPSNFFLMGSVAPTPAIEAALRAKRISPISPTEAA